MTRLSPDREIDLCRLFRKLFRMVLRAYYFPTPKMPKVTKSVVGSLRGQGVSLTHVWMFRTIVFFICRFEV